MALRNNAFAMLAVDSDSDDESQSPPSTPVRTAPSTPACAAPSTPARAAPSTPARTAPGAPKKKRQWKPLDLSTIAPPRRPQRGAPGWQKRAQTGQALPRFVRMTVDGKTVLVQVNKPVPKPTLEADSFPALLGTASVTTPVVQGSWANGVQAIHDAKELEDPAIKQRRREEAKAAWLRRQRAAQVTYADDYDDYDSDLDGYADDADYEEDIPVPIEELEELEDVPPADEPDEWETWGDEVTSRNEWDSPATGMVAATGNADGWWD